MRTSTISKIEKIDKIDSDSVKSDLRKEISLELRHRFAEKKKTNTLKTFFKASVIKSLLLKT